MGERHRLGYWLGQLCANWSRWTEARRCRQTHATYLSVRTVKRFVVEVQTADSFFFFFFFARRRFQTDFFISGIAPFRDELVVLAYIPAEEDAKAANGRAVVRSENLLCTKKKKKKEVKLPLVQSSVLHKLKIVSFLVSLFEFFSLIDCFFFCFFCFVFFFFFFWYSWATCQSCESSTATTIFYHPTRSPSTNTSITKPQIIDSLIFSQNACSTWFHRRSAAKAKGKKKLRNFLV